MKVTILVGLPGAGKSTYTLGTDALVINQDTLGSRDKCVGVMVSALQAGKDVIIDRTNINRQQRRYFIDVALNYGVSELRCVVLDVNPEEAIARIHMRKNHPTIKEEMSLDKKREIVYNFSKSYEPPSLDEGFNVVEFRRN